MGITSKRITLIAVILAITCAGFFTARADGAKDKVIECIPDPAPLAMPKERCMDKPYPGTVEWTKDIDARQLSRVGVAPENRKEESVSDDSPIVDERFASNKEDKKEIVINFTVPDSDKAPAPEKPGLVSDHIDHDIAPVIEPRIESSFIEELKPGTPAPGSVNNKGEVFDMVFGWVKPSAVINERARSDGDPNKMVGEMG